MSICEYCNKFFCDKRRPNSKICGSCRVSKRRWKSKIELVKKLGNKCSKCGYCEHVGALQFHHTDPNLKKFSINSTNLLRQDRIEESKKCILLCANCHAIEHVNSSLVNKFKLF